MIEESVETASFPQAGVEEVGQRLEIDAIGGVVGQQPFERRRIVPAPPLIPQAHGIPPVQPVDPSRPFDAGLPFYLFEPASPLERAACETEIQMRVIKREPRELAS